MNEIVLYLVYRLINETQWHQYDGTADIIHRNWLINDDIAICHNNINNRSW